jgi:XTP/dITP diphosphohydrolase
MATGNPHKVEELSRIFSTISGPGLRLVSAREVLGPGYAEPAETGSTFEANATLKAQAYAALTGLPSLADDSGLEVDALHGAPGVISSHYCTQGREIGMTRAERDAANNTLLLSTLADVPPSKRGGKFVCVMALALPPTPGSSASGTRVALARGELHGRIGLPGEVPRGEGGFGYDPLFLVAPDFAKTGAELSPEAKNAVSHRGQAARAMAREITRLGLDR